MKPRKIIVRVAIIAIVGILGGLVYFAFSFYHYISEYIPNAYAQEWVAGMVIDYLRQNDDRWPQSWEDLRPVYEQHTKKTQPWSFEELQSRVVIEWDVDVERLRHPPPRADGLPFRVIYLRDGTDAYWGGAEANRMLWSYLKEKEVRASTRPATTRAATRPEALNKTQPAPATRKAVE